MDIDIINQINESVNSEHKEVKAEELSNKDDILKKNEQTAKKIEEAKAILTAEMSTSKSSGLISKSKQSGSEKQSIFNKKEESKLDDFFGKSYNTSSYNKSSYNFSGYSHGSINNSDRYYYGQSSQKEEEIREERKRKFTDDFVKNSAKKACKEIEQDRYMEENSWNIFELQLESEEKRAKSRVVTIADKKKARKKDAFKKSLLMGAVEIGKSLVSAIYFQK